MSPIEWTQLHTEPSFTIFVTVLIVIDIDDHPANFLWVCLHPDLPCSAVFLVKRKLDHVDHHWHQHVTEHREMPKHA
jgi:hypothetical protein